MLESLFIESLHAPCDRYRVGAPLSSSISARIDEVAHRLLAGTIPVDCRSHRSFLSFLHQVGRSESLCQNVGMSRIGIPRTSRRLRRSASALTTRSAYAEYRQWRTLWSVAPPPMRTARSA